MKKYFLLLTLACLFGCMESNAQREMSTYLLADTSNGHTYPAPGPGTNIVDDGGSAGNYSVGHDYHYTLESDCDPTDPDRRLCLTFDENNFDVACTDTLYIYDGPSINSPLILKRNNCYSNLSGLRFYISANNTSGKITIRFRTKNNSVGGKGFLITAECAIPCESVKPVLDSIFDRTNLRTGEVIGHGVLRDVPAAFDTIFYTDAAGNLTDSVLRIDTVGWIKGALLCKGQGVIFHAHGDYSNYTGYYTPSDATSTFYWRVGTDSIFGVGKFAPRMNQFQETKCTDVYLTMEDVRGCRLSLQEQFQIRVAQNPVKTIYDLSSICNVDSLMVNVGYDGDNGTLTLKKINFAQKVTKVNSVRTFIPDGPNCPTKCYDAPVTFTEFNGRSITSADDICSICVNYEHTYMGDYRLSLLCPIYDQTVSTTRGEAVLKYGKYGTGSTNDPTAPADSPDGTSAGGGENTGWPLRTQDGTPVCDSLANPFGIGLDYCFSRNQAYTLVTGDAANVPTRFQAGNWYLSNGPTLQSNVTYPDPIPNYFTNGGGTTPNGGNMTTRRPSDHDNQTDYYSPSSDFTDLIGCPMNGEWKIRICDFWGADNGWVFNWSMDMCGFSASGGCEYQVGLDSVVWRPDTSATDFRDGKYVGLRINAADSVRSFISSPDTAGDFRIKLSIYDEFGCRWDTLTRISTVWTPRPQLGNDTALCDVHSITLDASDRHTAQANYSYVWEPFGEKTATVNTALGQKNDMIYVVQSSNSEKNVVCTARDTLVVKVNKQPIPNFDPGIYPLEGCEPLSITINNTSKYGDKYKWDFGDGTYSYAKDPSHAWTAGQYNFKYYIETENGCKDSLVYENLVTVYPNPVAKFSWEPVNPTVLHPSIDLVNQSVTAGNAHTHTGGDTRYFWEIQYDKNNPYSFQTLVEENPSYEWTSADNDPSGSYTVRLIARTDNVGPSGRVVYCADTSESTILLINDYLQFPTAVTPNGDGINDRFVIRNLVEGLGYPINSLDIYDRWGSRVFHAENINRDDQFWDPSTSNIPSGTYFYHFTAKGYNGNIERNGVVEVVK